MNHLNAPQPEPVRKEGEQEVWSTVWADLEERSFGGDLDMKALVLEDMQDRNQLGWQNHGGPLLTNDGRDTLVDAYQEVLDCCVYLKKGLLEGRLTGAWHSRVKVLYWTMIGHALNLRYVIEMTEGDR